jgi:hypothetical protein
MTSDLDIYRAAEVLIEQFASDAWLEASNLAKLSIGDGQLVWLRVMWATCSCEGAAGRSPTAPGAIA